MGQSCDGNGHCTCKPNFMGIKCDRCAPDRFNWPLCEACNCDPRGVAKNFFENGGCATVRTGELCTCKEKVTGRSCSQCAPGFYGFPDCKACKCPDTATCNEETGECICAPHATGTDEAPCSGKFEHFLT